MDERTAKKLTAALDRNSAALEQSNGINAALLKVLKPNVSKPVITKTGGQEQDFSDATLSRYVDGVR